jgi:hypothetical protein
MVKSRGSLLVFLIASVTVVASACCGQVTTVHYTPNFLVLAPSAKDPSYLTQSDGRQELTYSCEVEYPAENVIAFISKQLRANDWKLLKEDFMNPGLPSSHIGGWTDFEDGATKPSTHVYQWMADWENEGHDIVRYNLEYRSPAASTRDLHTLRVIALYIPAPVASEMKRTAAANRATHPPAPVNH